MHHITWNSCSRRWTANCVLVQRINIKTKDKFFMPSVFWYSILYSTLKCIFSATRSIIYYISGKKAKFPLTQHVFVDMQLHLNVVLTGIVTTPCTKYNCIQILIQSLKPRWSGRVWPHPFCKHWCSHMRQLVILIFFLQYWYMITLSHGDREMK